jgi:hypothetical protein
LDDVERIYGFDFNTTHPTPPLMSPTSSTFLPLAMVFQLFGSIGSLTVLALIQYQQRYSARTSGAGRIGQKAVCVADIFFQVVMSIFSVLILSSNRTPSMTACQATSFLAHSTGEIQCAFIAALAYERYWAICAIRDHGVIGGKAAPHWKYILWIVCPATVIHSALPWVTGGGYGAYGMKVRSLLDYLCRFYNLV